jgi:hypothetical protein
VTVYDQTGGTNHLTQSIPENQPVLQPQGPVRQLSSPQVLGGEVFSASSVYGYIFTVPYAFNDQYYNHWHSDGGIYEYGTGIYTGTTSTEVDGSSRLGEWLQIQFPQSIYVTKCSISPRENFTTRVPSKFTLAASNDGLIWTSIGRYTDILQSVYEYQKDTEFTPGDVGMFSYYRIIFEKLYSSGSVQITQFKIWGVPLQDLDGSMRIGGYLTPVSHPADNSYVYQQGTTITELTQDTTQPVENPDLGAAALVESAPVTGPYELNGYSVEASSVNEDYYPTLAFNNKTYGSDIWLSSGALPAWLRITYPESVVCSRYTIRSRDPNDPNFTRYPKAWTLQGLSSEGHWIILDDRVETSWDPNTVKEYLVSKPVACSTYRLYFTDAEVVSGTQYVAISEWRLFTTTARQDHDTIYMLPGSLEENPNLGGAVLVDGAGYEGPYELDGYVVEASSAFDYRRPVIDAFNKTNVNNDDCWHSVSGLPQWISITFPAVVYIHKYDITSRTDVLGLDLTTNWTPHTWILQGSKDQGTTWTDIHTQYRQGQDIHGYNLTKSFSVNSTTSYTTYRLYITEALSKNTIVTSYVCIAEWRLYTTPNPGLGKLLAKNTLATQSQRGQIRVPKEMPIQAVSYQDLVSLISVSRKDLVVNLGKTSITDQASKQEWDFGGSVALVLEDGVPCVDLSGGSLTLNGTGATLGREYTLVYYWKPLVGATTWRTLHQNESLEWLVLISRFGDFVELGTYTGPPPGFRGTGYNINPGTWQTLIVTNTGDTVTSNIGTGTFYVNDNQVGTTDRVGCGTTLTYLGRYSSQTQPPGHVAVAGVFNRILNRKEITKVHRLLERWGQGQYTQEIPKSVGRTYYNVDIPPGASCILDAQFGYTDSTTWNDISGYNLHATWGTVSTGSHQNRRYYDAANTYCVGSPSNNYGITNSSGFTVFISYSVPEATSAAVSLFYGSSSREIYVHLPYSNGTIIFDQGGCCNADTRTVSPVLTNPYNVWHTVAFVRTSGSPNTRKIYYDSDLLVENPTDAAPLNFDNRRVYITTIPSWPGKLKSFIVYPRDLSDIEIQQLHTKYTTYPQSPIGMNDIIIHNKASMAFSLVNLTNGAYTGPVVRVRRSDAVEEDFYADGFTLKTGTGQTLVEWVAGLSHVVTRLYDQSGNNNHIGEYDPTKNLPTIDPATSAIQFNLSPLKRTTTNSLPQGTVAVCYQTTDTSANDQCATKNHITSGSLYYYLAILSVTQTSIAIRNGGCSDDPPLYKTVYSANPGKRLWILPTHPYSYSYIGGNNEASPYFERSLVGDLFCFVHYPVTLSTTEQQAVAGALTKALTIQEPPYIGTVPLLE